jgi:ABC-type branched-subunit amino acid transport system substrate-binding protein
MSGKPIKLGVLLDEPRYERPDFLLNALSLKLEEFNAAGGVEGRQVTMRLIIADGAHAGLPENLRPAFREMAADPEVVGIIGPGVTDNCLVLVDEVDRAQVPTLGYPGSEDCRGEWFFQYQLGSFAWEALFLARAMAKAGRRRVGVLQSGAVGAFYCAHFEREARLLGLTIVGKAYADVHQSDVTGQVGALREQSPDAILFLGMGEPTLPFAATPGKLGWRIPVYANIAMMRVGGFGPAELRAVEGLVWVDQYEPRNPTLQAFEAAYRARYGEPPHPYATTPAGYDMMTLMTEGLKRAPNLSRAGLKAGLEQTRQIPAAAGGLAVVMGFDKWDRQALKGPDVMTYRRVRDGRVETFEP